MLQATSNRTVKSEGSTFAIARAGTYLPGILTNYDSPYYNINAGSYLSGGLHHFYRGFVLFSIPAGIPDNVNRVRLWLAFNDVHIGTPYPNLYVQKGNQGSNPASSADSTVNVATPAGEMFCEQSVNGYSTGVYYGFDFNADGVTDMLANRGGNVQYCYRGHRDYNDNTASSIYSNYVYIRSAQHPSTPPLLEIGYKDYNEGIIID